jgi:hypothetical protein
MQGTSPEYRQKCVVLADRLEDCLRGQDDFALHALALTLVSVTSRWEDPFEALHAVHEQAINLLRKARAPKQIPCPQGQDWIKKRMRKVRQRA